MENAVLLDAVRTNLDRLTKQTSNGELPLLVQLEDAMFHQVNQVAAVAALILLRLPLPFLI